MGIPVIEQAKIQAQVLVPLVKALQAELGEDRANALVRKALGEVYRHLGGRWWRTKESKHVGDNMASAFAAFAEGDAIDYSVRAQSQDTYGIEVTGCRYAQFYKELGEPELGFLLVCSLDFPFAEGFDPDIKLTRTQTRFSLQAAERPITAFWPRWRESDRIKSIRGGRHGDQHQADHLLSSPPRCDGGGDPQ